MCFERVASRNMTWPHCNGLGANALPDGPLNGAAKQHGMVLLISLGLLLALTLGAVSAAQTVILEQRMTRNEADAARAFLAAEAALATVEAEIESGTITALLPAQAYGDDPPWRVRDWSQPGPVHAVAMLVGVQDQSGNDVDVYRITVREEGPAGAVAWLQTTYGVVNGGGDSPLAGRLSWVTLTLD